MNIRMSPIRDVLRSLNLDGARGAFAAGLVTVLALPTLLAGPRAALAGRYARQQIIDGEWWRLLSAHAVHLDAAHAVANLFGVLLVWVLVGRELSLPRWTAAILVCAAGVSAGLWWGSPEVAWYVGASGLLNGMLACGALLAALRGDRLAILVLAILGTKILAEQVLGPLPFSGELPVITVAHLYGALAGGALGLYFALRTDGYNRRPL